MQFLSSPTGTGLPTGVIVDGTASFKKDSILLENARGGFERLDLFLSAKNLPQLHAFNVTDAFAVVYYLDHKHNTLMGVGNTEVVNDNLNPLWTKPVTVDYLFEQVQEIFIHVFHCTDPSNLNEIECHEFIGEIRFTLSSIMRAPSQKLALLLTNPSKPNAVLGSVEIRAEAQRNTRDMLVIKVNGSKLTNKEGFFGRSDPFLEISRSNNDGSYTPVWRSNKIDSTLNPKWPEVKISLVTLCNSDLDRKLIIEVWDHERSGRHRSMGKVRATVRELLDARGTPFEVIEEDRLQSQLALNVDENDQLNTVENQGSSQREPKSGYSMLFGGGSKADYTNSGYLTFERCRIEHHPTLSDFIMGGCEISLIVGIDYTGSNGDPHDPTSLHYIDPANRTWNIYQQAIYSVGNVLEPYDSDRLYCVFGFGARVRLYNAGVGGGKTGIGGNCSALGPGASQWMTQQTANGGAAIGGSLNSGSYYGNHYHNSHLPISTAAKYTSVQHCFPIYGGTNQVAGVAGILQAYQDGLQNVLLSGPTLLAPIITATAQLAANDGCTQMRQRYSILLLITDGVVNDMEATKLAIIEASRQPMSIIIVGVGPADFKDMDSLDSDRQLLQVNRQIADRDIVQFIP
jgi:hypothetical protein